MASGTRGFCGTRILGVSCNGAKMVPYLRPYGVELAGNVGNVIELAFMATNRVLTTLGIRQWSQDHSSSASDIWMHSYRVP